MRLWLTLNDMLVAHHINAMQYVALQMMIAKHFGWKVGKFFYFINNLHIYDNQFEQAEELLRREPSDCHPRLVLNVPDGTNFFDIKQNDFELLDYIPVKTSAEVRFGYLTILISVCENGQPLQKVLLESYFKHAFLQQIW